MKIYKLFALALCAFVLAACNAASTGSPTETLKKFVDASQKKDVAAMKQTLSKGTMELIEKSAQQQKTTVDELLKKDSPTQMTETPEIRNEKIEGDTATVEVKNTVTGNFDTLPFVKEDGQWKLALDKFMQDVMKRMSEEMKNAGQNPPPANAQP